MSRGRGQDFRVTIVSARNVRGADILGGKSDPYCVCEVVGRRNQNKQQTPTVSNTNDPKWNYTFEVKDCAGEEDLKFTIYDSDVGSRDDVVGVGTLQAHQYFPEGWDGELRLGSTKGEASFLKVRVVPAEPSYEDGASGRAAARPGGSPGGSPRLGGAAGRRPAGSAPGTFSVTVVSARNVRPADPLGGQSDPYCVCEVVGRRNEKQQKTRIVNNTKNPTWNFTYEVKDCTGVEDLRFTVYDSDAGSRDDLVGSATMRASLYFPEGFDGELRLEDKKAKSPAFLKVRVVPAEGDPAAGLGRPPTSSPSGSPRGHALPPGSGRHALPPGLGTSNDGFLVLEGGPSRRPPRAQGIEHSLNEGVEQAERLEERAKKLQEHFEQAQHCMNSINALCEEADACILKSQTTLNKTAKKIHDLTRRASNLHLGQDAHHAVDDFGEAVHQPEISSRRGKVGRAAAAPAPQLR